MDLSYKSLGHRHADGGSEGLWTKIIRSLGLFYHVNTAEDVPKGTFKIVIDIGNNVPDL
jgi:hypothetical protein